MWWGTDVSQMPLAAPHWRLKAGHVLVSVESPTKGGKQSCILVSFEFVDAKAMRAPSTDDETKIEMKGDIPTTPPTSSLPPPS